MGHRQPRRWASRGTNDRHQPSARFAPTRWKPDPCCVILLGSGTYRPAHRPARGRSSVGRALASQAGCRGFESLRPLCFVNIAEIMTWINCRGQQVGGSERFRVPQVSVQGLDQGATFRHDPHSGMVMAVNPSLVCLGVAEPALQAEIVTPQLRRIVSREQTRLKAAHRPGYLPSLFVGAGLEALSQCLLVAASVSRSPYHRDRSLRQETIWKVK